MYMYYLVGYKLMSEQKRCKLEDDRPIFYSLDDKVKKKVSSADEILKVYTCY